MEGGAGKSFGELGKRIERLFYFGTLLLLLACLNLYFVSVANYVERENLDDVSALISSINKNFEQLTETFHNPPKKVASSKKIVESDQVSQLRKSLGLSPREEESEYYRSVDLPTYAELLKKSVGDIRYQTRLSQDSLAIVQDSSKSPKEIVSLLEVRREQLAKRPVTIWGVESPLILPLQYGGARYQIPASFVARSMTLKLLPLFLGWLGSSYLTRHRELLLIRRNRYYGPTFPHVLNIFPSPLGWATLSSLPFVFEIKEKRQWRYGSKSWYLAYFDQLSF